MGIVTPDVFREVTDAIVEAVSPEKIILFGSQARGEAGPGSDIDLVVIEREPFGVGRSRRAEAARISWACRRFEIPQDVVLCTEAENGRLKESLNHPIGRATCEGRVVYERH